MLHKRVSGEQSWESNQRRIPLQQMRNGKRTRHGKQLQLLHSLTVFVKEKEEALLHPIIFYDPIFTAGLEQVISCQGGNEGTSSPKDTEKWSFTKKMYRNSNFNNNHFFLKLRWQLSQLPVAPATVCQTVCYLATACYEEHRKYLYTASWWSRWQELFLWFTASILIFTISCERNIYLVSQLLWSQMDFTQH